MPGPGLISLGEWRPDVADYEGEHSKTITNVYPRGDGYGPIQSLVPYTAALGGQCMGAFYALKNDGTIAIFAATSTKLYLLNNGTQTWIDVSKGGGSYTAPPIHNIWQFAQFNNFVIAVQQNTVPQVIDLTSPTAFADLGGSPPQAAYIAIVNRFVVLSGIASPNVYRIQWSGLNSITTWDNINLLSNFQDLADGGLVTGVAGGEWGFIFQQRSIRRMIFQPGSAVIFSIDRVSKDDGMTAPYSLVQAADRIFWYSEQGFKMLQSGGLPTPIGKERIDRTFQADLDFTEFGFFVGAADPQSQRVYWSYHSINAPTGVFDTLLIYDWVLDRWSKALLTGEMLAPLTRAGLTLEAVDAAYANPATPVNVSSFTKSTTVGDTFTVPASPPAGQGLNFTATTLPSGYTTSVPYYVKATSRTSVTFKVSASGGVGALEGAAVTSTSTGSGTLAYFQPTIEMVAIGSLDDITASALPALGAADGNHQLGFFAGPNLEATLETAQHGATLKRIYVRGYKPITDSPFVFGALSYTENLFTSVTISTEDEIDNRGWVWPGVSTRYARARLRIPAGTSWNYAAGVEPDIAIEGQR